VETPAATLSRVLDPINRISPTTKSTARQSRNLKRQNYFRTKSLRTAPPGLSLCMVLSRHDSVCLAQELGEKSPGWPIKCLAVPRRLIPGSRWRFVTAPELQTRLSALRVIAGLLHATPAQHPGALLWSLVDHLEAQRSPPAPSPPNGECRMKNVECRVRVPS
jgi:hypothetical protein